MPNLAFICRSDTAPPMGDVTEILQQLEQGNASAGEQLLVAVYDELRKLAASKMNRESTPQTLQPTALVHEAWLRLGGESQPTWQNRAHFFAAAAEAMRRILIERARHRSAVKHGGGQLRVTFQELDNATVLERDDSLIALDEALAKLARDHPRKVELVKLRYFAGLTMDEAAQALGISEPTAKRWWAYARAWLFEEMKLT